MLGATWIPLIKILNLQALHFFEILGLQTSGNSVFRKRFDDFAHQVQVGDDTAQFDLGIAICLVE